MLEALLAVLVAALLCAVLWFVGSKLPFMGGFPMQVLSWVLAVIWIFYALHRFGVIGSVGVKM